MDNGLTVPKWVLIVCPKIPQMPENLLGQFVCPTPNILDFNEKRLYWASVVRALYYSLSTAWPESIQIKLKKQDKTTTAYNPGDHYQ